MVAGARMACATCHSWYSFCKPLKESCMSKKFFTNADLKGVDWAQQERTSLLRSLHSKKMSATGAGVSSSWGTIVMDADRRSVRAYLMGKGDLRSSWWNIYCTFYLMIVPRSTVERAMYSFHKFHHRLTLARLEFLSSFLKTSSDIREEGVLEATRKSFLRELNR